MTIVFILLAVLLIAWLLGSFRISPIKEEPYDNGKSQWENWFSLNIVGESHYQKEIRCCHAGEKVRLTREPMNKYDDMAVRVDSARGETIGYLSQDRARWLGGDMDNGTAVDSHIERITGEGRESRGIVLRIKLIYPLPPAKASKPKRVRSKKAPPPIDG